MPRNNAGLWVLCTPVLCALIAAQIWSAYSVRRDLDDLRAYLASSVDAAMQLNQRMIDFDHAAMLVVMLGTTGRRGLPLALRSHDGGGGHDRESCLRREE